MFLDCCSPRADPKTKALLVASMQASHLAEEVLKLSVTTQTRGLQVVGMANNVKSTLSEFKHHLNVSSFKALMDALDAEKMKEAIAVVMEMDKLALDCLTRSTEMKDKAMEGTRSLSPDQYEKQTGYETDSEEGDQDLADLETAIVEIERCNKDIHSMNLFSAASKGTRAFQVLSDKGTIIQKTFARIQDLCNSIVVATHSVVSENCFSMLTSGVNTIKAMVDSLRLSNLLTKLAQAAKRLIHAMKSLVMVAIEKFQDFTQQFRAGRKIKRFTHGLKDRGVNLLTNKVHSRDIGEMTGE
jgi:hypothetical protein